MNDLMTKSFLSYVELKKQAQRDLESEENDIEKGQFNFNPAGEHNLSQFFQEVEAIKVEMEVITNLFLDLQNLKGETKSTHSTKILRGLRDRMESDIVSILRKSKMVKSRIEVLDKSNMANRRMSGAFKEGSAVDRTRTSITNGLRAKLREIMNDFQRLRLKILSDYREDLKRKYYMATGEEPDEEAIDKMISGSAQVGLCEVRPEMDSNMRARHEAVMEIRRSLNRLHQVFLDMAVLVEAQGEKIDDIEENVFNAGMFIAGGTDSLHYANQMKKNKKWVLWVWAVAVIILLVCVVSMLLS